MRSQPTLWVITHHIYIFVRYAYGGAQKHTVLDCIVGRWKRSSEREESERGGRERGVYEWVNATSIFIGVTNDCVILPVEMYNEYARGD